MSQNEGALDVQPVEEVKENKDNNVHPEEVSQQPKEDELPKEEEKKEPEPEVEEPEVQPASTELSKTNLVPLTRTDFSMEVAKKWSRLVARGPPKRRSYHTSFIYKNKDLYIIGGVDITERKQNDIYKIHINSTNPQWEKIDTKDKSLDKIAYHAGVLYNGVYYIIGGQDETLRSSNVIQKFSVEDGTILDPIVPDQAVFPPLESHTAELYGNTAIVFGGHTNKTYNRNVYSINLDDGTVTNLTEGLKEEDENLPKPRQLHSSLIYQDTLYIYGGYGPDETYYHDIWAFSLSSKSFAQIKFDDDNEHCPGICPLGRSGASFVEIGGMFYIFGGKIGLIKESNELWRFNPGTSKFELIHDSLIEKFTAEELEKTKKISDEQKKTKKQFKLLTRHEVEQRTNPLPFSLKNSKVKKNKQKEGEKNHTHNSSFTEVKQTHSNEVLSRPNVTKMKKSLIYTSSGDELHNALNQLGEDEKAMLDKDSGLIVGEVPEPRDGQTVNLYRGSKLLLFGGDRNKFPFNDLYFFDTQGVTGVTLENTYQPPAEEQKVEEPEEADKKEEEQKQNEDTVEVKQ